MKWLRFVLVIHEKKETEEKYCILVFICLLILGKLIWISFEYLHLIG